MKSDAMAENFNSDEIGVVPCKKRKTDSSVDTARENAEPGKTLLFLKILRKNTFQSRKINRIFIKSLRKISFASCRADQC